jgi:hypothetical protein
MSLFSIKFNVHTFWDYLNFRKKSWLQNFDSWVFGCWYRVITHNVWVALFLFLYEVWVCDVTTQKFIGIKLCYKNAYVQQHYLDHLNVKFELRVVKSDFKNCRQTCRFLTIRRNIAFINDKKTTFYPFPDCNRIAQPILNLISCLKL